MSARGGRLLALVVGLGVAGWLIWGLRAGGVDVSDVDVLERSEAGSKATRLEPPGTAMTVGGSDTDAPKVPVDTSPDGLRDAPTIQVRIVDGLGRPVAGALVVSGANVADVAAAGRTLQSEAVRRRVEGVSEGSVSVPWPVDVHALVPPRRVGLARTDADGRVTVTDRLLLTLADGFAAEIRGLEGADVVLSLGGKVTGRVVGDGSVAEVAAIFPKVGNGYLWTVSVDVGESFVINWVPAGEVSLEVEDPRAIDLHFDGVVVPAGGVVDVGDLDLYAGDSIEGVVLATDGTPAAGVNITLDAEDAWRRQVVEGRIYTGRTWVNTRTADDGTFAVYGLATGTFNLHTIGGGGCWTRLGGVASGSHDVVIRLRPCGSVIVDARDARYARPIESPEISVAVAEGYRGQPHSTWQYTVHRLDDGRTRVDGFGGDGVVLSVRAPGYSREVVEVPPFEPGGTRSLSVTLWPEVVLSGVVLGAGDEPVAGATVQVAPLDRLEATRMFRTEADGAFRFESMRRGDWELWTTASGHRKASLRPVVVAEGMAPVEVRLEPVASVVGTVVAMDGSLAAGATVVLGSGVDDLQFRRTDDDGSFKFDGLHFGEYTIAASWRDWSLVEFEPSSLRLIVGAEPREPIVLEVPVPASITGVVTTGTRARPGVAVSVFFGSRDGEWDQVGSTTTGDDGRFTLEGLAAGSYTIVARDSAHAAPAAENRQLGPGEVAVVALVLGGRVIEGIVLVDGTDEPVEGAIVEATLQSPSHHFLRHRANVASGRGGRFALPGARAGRYRLAAHGAQWFYGDRLSVDVDERWSPDPVTLHVLPAAQVWGEVLDAFGHRPATGLSVQVFAVGTNKVSGHTDVTLEGYRIPRLLPGSYEVRVLDYDAGMKLLDTQVVTLAEGEHARVDFIVGR